MSLSKRKHFRAFSVSVMNRPIVIKPFIFKVPNSPICLTKFMALSGCTPSLLSSKDVFTRINILNFYFQKVEVDAVYRRNRND